MKSIYRMILTAGVILFFLIRPVFAFSQQERSKEDEKKWMVMLSREPEYPGGSDAMQKFISKNLKYPVQARERKITGKVTVTVTVEENGQLTKPLVTEGIGWGCDEEAVRLVNLMPKWRPAEAEGKAVKTGARIQVIFMLYPVVEKRPKRASDSD
jgi:protein TonB